MKTTLTIDDDVAIELERLRREGDQNLKDVINDVLRRGLRGMRACPKQKSFHTASYDMGAFLSNIDNVAEAIAYTEGENFK
jgi:hypothetical protein